MPTVQLTVAVPSYQRKDPLLRLIESLTPEVEQVRAVGGEVKVIVVIDGSTDGSAQAVEALQTPFTLDVRWQPNRGLAAARNVGLDAAAGGLVLFLDDDLVPTPGLLLRHYLAHQGGDPRVLLGPCTPVAPPGHSPGWRLWWEVRYEELSHTGRVERFDQFTVANASGPAHLFTQVGGFDETFTGYGGEDYELGVRLLRHGVTVDYDHDAEALHYHQEDDLTDIVRQRSIGRNYGLLVARHPELESEVFPLGPRSLPVRLVAAVPMRSPHTFRSIAWMAKLVFGRTWVPPRWRFVAYNIAHTASFATGVAEADSSLLRRVLDGRAR